MKSIIVGGGKVGYYLLKTLNEKKYDIVLIERDINNCQAIADDIDADIIYGDGTDIDVLKDAGIEDAEIVAAVTGTDEENLVICEIAKTSFGIPKTIARVNNPINMSMFKALGVDKTVCSTQVIANLIESEFDKENFKIIQTFERGSMILVDIEIERAYHWCDSLIKNLELPQECIIASILRDEKVVYPKGNTKILEFDNIMVLTNSSGLVELKKLFRSQGDKK
ncbi:MAG: TrkA family potassium uptake protein [Oscillospiraceae bacterium]